MMLPDDARLMMPLLNRIAAAAAPVSIGELAEDREMRKLLPGNWHHFETSLRWVATYLEKEDLVINTGEGRYAITAAGLRKMERGTEGGPEADRISLARTFGRMEQALRTELLARLYAMSPDFFEEVVVHLLVAMGYSNDKRGLAQRIGSTGDGGIDGIVALDELGLDSVYIQAKRYRPGTAVPVNDVRDFAGSLEQHKAVKGIFATTALFSRSAQEFAAQISRRIVLIDGKRFCSLMLKHNIGVRMIEVWELKAIDSDYFASAHAGRIETSHMSSASIQPRR